MSHWSYRVIEQDDLFFVHEVYYDDAGEVEGWSSEPAVAQGETLDELRGEFTSIGTAFFKPVIKIEVIGTEADGWAEHSS